MSAASPRSSIICFVPRNCVLRRLSLPRETLPAMAQAARDPGAVATWLMHEGLGPSSAPILILSENHRAALNKRREGLAKKLAQFNRARQGSADTIACLLILKDPPSAEAGEITDKRSINQKLVMRRRADEVAALYSRRVDPRLIEPAIEDLVPPQCAPSKMGALINCVIPSE